jgi:lipoyl(octanoyl) transferase
MVKMQDYGGEYKKQHQSRCLIVTLQQIDHGNRDFVALDLNLAFGHRLVVGQDGEGVVLMGIELNHRATAHAQQLMHGNDRAAQHHRDLDLYIIQVGSHAARPYIVWAVSLPAYGFGKLNLDTLKTRPEWKVSAQPMPYPEALAVMEARADAIAAGTAEEEVWLLEHPPVYTAGTSAKDADLIEARFPVYRTGRGGQFTYHGPGQRVAYVMLDLKQRRPDVRAFVAALEAWLIDTLAAFDINGERREERVGVWVRRPDKPAGVDGAVAEDKIAALGIRVRRWVSFHGVALNVAPALSHFSGIVPCGIAEAHYGVTSLRDLGRDATMADADRALRAAFVARFGATIG